MSTGHKTRRRAIHFDTATKDKLDVRVQDAGVATSLEDNALKFNVTAAGNSVVDLGGNGIPRADLMCFEAVMEFDSFDEQLDVRVGMASAFNVDPDVIPEAAFFKLRGQAGAANSNQIFVETRDAIRDLKDTPTRKQVGIGAFQRYRIDFATGTQSISAPGKSKGGYGSVRFSAGRQSAHTDKIFMEHILPAETAKHMDMDDAAGPFQPFIQVRALANPTAPVVCYLKEICLEYRVY